MRRNRRRAEIVSSKTLETSETRLQPRSGRIYASPVSRTDGTFVVAASPEFELLAHNPLGAQDEVFPAVASGRLYLRSDRYLYCVRGSRSAE